MSAPHLTTVPTESLSIEGFEVMDLDMQQAVIAHHLHVGAVSIVGAVAEEPHRHPNVTGANVVAPLERLLGVHHASCGS
jgi:hypothetical protein